MNRFTIKTKLFLSNCILAILSVLVIWLVVSNVYIQLLQDKQINYVKNLSESSKQQIDFLLQLTRNTGSYLGSNAEFLNILTSNDDMDKETDLNEILKSAVMLQDYINSIFVFDANGHFYTSDFSVNENHLKKIAEQYSLSKNNNARNDRFEFIRNAAYRKSIILDTILYLQPVFDRNTEDMLGLIMIEIDSSTINQLLTVFSIQNDEKLLLVDAEQNVIVNFPYNSNLSDIPKSYPQLMEERNVSIEGSIFGEQNFIVSTSIGYTDWKLIRAIPFDHIYEEIDALNLYIWIAAIILFFICIIISSVLSSTFIAPIKKLRDKILMVEKGDLKVRSEVSTNDELGQLSNSFDRMVVRLDRLITDRINDEKKKAEMNLQILQAQINPHFLYNTLDTIKWMANIQNVPSVANSIIYLINLLKYNINVKETDVLLEEEIDNIINYVNLQKLSMGDTFEVEISVSDDLRQCRILKFILQPIVENAIFHGFDETKDEFIIQIKAITEKDCLIIDVIDNGVGMQEDTVNSILEKDYKAKFSGIGIKNIDERIKLYFGEQYGLKFHSTLGKNTTVTLTMPLIEN
ncbi:sensor histidine kinase [Clostridium formicaceticum]|uniref:Sensor histidine kinase YehU n=1 Tax=Clostridium formicaceticum TaxID=1497 RepID=A0AAC9RRR5_9CLOT|nr:sensor histidine kinase [Clostridium formicaceticum]AOY74633.1 hypothetical protein BJL90_00875 [Clostridium formicaceticum]ARE89000.1 Sensor histidine kinase YehU [Clostridium formicaceticum]